VQVADDLLFATNDVVTMMVTAQTEISIPIFTQLHRCLEGIPGISEEHMWWQTGSRTSELLGTRRYTLHRSLLKRAALRYVSYGWDVVPGAYLTGDRFHCGRHNCPTVACHPALPGWEEQASHDGRTVAKWWSQLPYTILLPTGRAFDALEVPAALGPGIAAGVDGPVIASPDGHWFFLVRAGDGLRPELQQPHLGVLLHGLGSWIPAPPQRQQGGRVRWQVRPEDCPGPLPDSYAVQRAALTALVGPGDRAVQQKLTAQWSSQAA